MIIVLKPDASEEQVSHIVEKMQKLGLTPHVSKGTERTIIGVIGPEDVLRVTPLEAFAGVFDFLMKSINFPAKAAFFFDCN